jgi:hypothetical protein
MTSGANAAPDGGLAPRPPAWWRRPVAVGPLGTLLASRAFVPMSLALALMLLAGTGLQAVSRVGWVLPSL